MLTRNPIRRQEQRIKRETRRRERQVALGHDLDMYRNAGHIARIAPGEHLDGEVQIHQPCGKWLAPTRWGNILDTECLCTICKPYLDTL